MIDDQKARQWERLHHQLQWGGYLQLLFEDDGCVCASRWISDPWYNNGWDLRSGPGWEHRWTEAAQRLAQEGRPPAVYERSTVPPVVSRVERAAAGWKACDEELWMTAVPGQTRGRENPLVVVRQASASEADTFAQVYRDGFAGTFLEPEAYAGRVEARFQGRAGTADFFPLLAFRGGKAVGCAYALVSGRFSGLYGVAVVPDQRKRGIAGALVGAALEVCLSAGAEVTVLQVEAGSAAAEVYRRCGFEEAFSRTGFTKNPFKS